MFPQFLSVQLCHFEISETSKTIDSSLCYLHSLTNSISNYFHFCRNIVVSMEQILLSSLLRIWTCTSISTLAILIEMLCAKLHKRNLSRSYAVTSFPKRSSENLQGTHTTAKRSQNSVSYMTTKMDHLI